MSLNLYDILKEVINEETTPYDVTDAINNKQKVIISYDDEKHHRVGPRLVEPYVIGTNHGGNTAVRIFQGGGDTHSGVPMWKTIRLDRIVSWKPTDDHFYRPPNKRGWNVEDYNNEGDGSFSTIFAQVHFNDDDLNNNDSLYAARSRTRELQNSTPSSLPNTNGENGKDYGPISNSTTSTAANDNLPNFQKGLNKNLDIDHQPQDTNINANDPTQTQQNQNIPRGPIEPQTQQSYWDDYDKAQGEANYQNNPNLYRKSGELRTNQRELERDRRRKEFSAADERPLWRKGALNNNQ